MKQIRYDYYCTLKKRGVGMGLCCFCCDDRKKSNIAHKMCEYEKIVREYTVEV